MYDMSILRLFRFIFRIKKFVVVYKDVTQLKKFVRLSKIYLYIIFAKYNSRRMFRTNSNCKKKLIFNNQITIKLLINTYLTIGYHYLTNINTIILFKRIYIHSNNTTDNRLHCTYIIYTYMCIYIHMYINIYIYVYVPICIYQCIVKLTTMLI